MLLTKIIKKNLSKIKIFLSISLHIIKNHFYAKIAIFFKKKIYLTKSNNLRIRYKLALCNTSCGPFSNKSSFSYIFHFNVFHLHAHGIPRRYFWNLSIKILFCEKLIWIEFTKNLSKIKFLSLKSSSLILGQKLTKIINFPKL